MAPPLHLAIVVGLAALGSSAGARLAPPAPSPSPDVPPARVQAQPGPTLEAGARGAVSLVWLEAPERDLPLQVRIDADDGLVPLGNRLGWADVVDPGAHLPRVEARLRAGATPGVYAVRARVRYWVCGAELCWLRDGQVSWQVTVTPPPADGASTTRMGIAAGQLTRAPGA